jgi:aryl-alcohol dehydrogenase-like predicted oxidoreductase
VGFGGYRINEFDPDHREALRNTLLSGCNLIDTSSNYGDGSSERLVGQVLTELCDEGKVKREEIVLVTKGGYVQGENLKNARQRKEGGDAFPEMVEFQDDCWHNISPSFLEDQITRSLERLKQSEIDVFLLHNPEYFLKSNGTREVYYQRIENAFRHLESECQKGRIKFYGISSNTFPEDEARSDYTSLTRILEIAKAVNKSHHFAVVQFPFNLYEPGAALLKNNDKRTVLELAQHAGLGVLVNRPFNSFARGRMTRLTSFTSHDQVEVKGGLHVTLGRAIELEKKAPGFPKSPQGLQWAHVLRERLGDLDDLLSWRDALYQQILPSIRQALSRLTVEREHWATDYQSAMSELLKLITWDLENLAVQRSTVLGEQVDQAAPELKNSPTLSQKMIRLYTSFPQISSILVGMRTPKYVKDTMSIAGEPLTPQRAAETLGKFQRHRN